jgi:hypothetical protein
LCTHTCLLHSSVLFGISSTTVQYQMNRRTTSADLTISRPLSPSRCPYGALLFMYLFYASIFLEPILDSVLIKIFIHDLYAFILWYVLWYFDNSIVYMRDLILAHIWLLNLYPCKSGVTLTSILVGPVPETVAAAREGVQELLEIVVSRIKHRARPDLPTEETPPVHQ